MRIEADGLHARVLQHEIDHLDGVLIIDRATPEERKAALQRYREAQASRGQARSDQHLTPRTARGERRARRIHGHARVRRAVACARSQRRHDVVGVFTRPDAVSGRGKARAALGGQDRRARARPARPPAAHAARRRRTSPSLRELDAGPLVVAAYGLILPRERPRGRPARRRQRSRIAAAALAWRRTRSSARSSPATRRRVSRSCAWRRGSTPGPYCLQARDADRRRRTRSSSPTVSRSSAPTPSLEALPAIADGSAVWTPQDEAARHLRREDHEGRRRASLRSWRAETRLRRVRASLPAAPAADRHRRPRRHAPRRVCRAIDRPLCSRRLSRSPRTALLLGVADGAIAVAAAEARRQGRDGRGRLGARRPRSRRRDWEPRAMSASPARRLAREVLTRVRERSAYGHEVARRRAASGATLAADDAAFATRLAYGTLQTEGTLDEAIDRYLGGKRLEPRVRDALRVAAYEILFLRTRDRAPPCTRASSSCETVRPQAAGLANAVLRRLAEDAADLPLGRPRRPTTAALARLHAPSALARRHVDRASSGATLPQQVMAADNEPAPLFLAVNPFVATVDEARAGAAKRTAPTRPVRRSAAACEPVTPAPRCAGARWRDGLVLRVRRGGAARRAARAGHGPAQRSSRSARAEAPRRSSCRPLRSRRRSGRHLSRSTCTSSRPVCSQQRLARFGVPGRHALVGDATRPRVDRGLRRSPARSTPCSIDAPCTGSGTLRRHPEKRWRVTPARHRRRSPTLGSRLLDAGAASCSPRRFRGVLHVHCRRARERRGRSTRFSASEQGSAFARRLARRRRPGRVAAVRHRRGVLPVVPGLRTVRTATSLLGLCRG